MSGRGNNHKRAAVRWPRSLDVGRLIALDRLPYLATAIAALHPVERPGVGTLGVDRYWRLYYEPDYCDRLDPAEAAGAIAHEVSHLCRRHHERAEAIGAAAPKVWNIAADAEINPQILSDGLALPAGVIMPRQFGEDVGLIAEVYYARLMAQDQPPGPGGDGGDGGDEGEEGGARVPGDGDGDGDGDEGEETGAGGQSQDGDEDGAEGEGAEGEGAEGEGEGDGTRSAGAGDGDGDGAGSGSGAGTSDAQDGTEGASDGASDGPAAHGSGAGADPADWEDAPPAEGEPGISEGVAEGIRRQVAQDIQQAAKSRGVGAGWQAWADVELSPPTVPWHRILRAAIRRGIAETRGAVDYSYSRPSRRAQAYAPIIAPAMVAPVPEVAIILDTSGSMSSEMGRAVSEVGGCLRALGAATGADLLCVDSAVHSVGRVWDARHVRPMGGGGTDMRAGYLALAARRRQPDVVICITDGWTDYPAAPMPPGARHIVVLTPGGRSDNAPKSWARVIQMTAET